MITVDRMSLMETESTDESPSAAAASDEKPESQVITDKELSECDREQLHLIGHIQGDAGHTLFISYPEARIVGADAVIGAVPWIRQDLAAANKRQRTDNNNCDVNNTVPAAARNPAPMHNNGIENGNMPAMIGDALQSWIPYDLYTEMIEAAESMKKAKSTRTFLFYKHENDAYAISLSTPTHKFAVICIEIESVENTEAAGDFYNTLVSLGRVMEFYADEEVLKNACDTVFKLLGNYDRGMVYQFNDDNSGQVIHEIKRDHVTTSYQGMRFPASDIPLTARQLYIKNGLRYIENVDADDLPIVCEEGIGDVDLSNCRMRAVSKPHIIYLRNMGIVCSLSVAIVVEQELWGLLAFHGYKKPFKPSLHQRIACETVSRRLPPDRDFIGLTLLMIQLCNSADQFNGVGEGGNNNEEKTKLPCYRLVRRPDEMGYKCRRGQQSQHVRYVRSKALAELLDAVCVRGPNVVFNLLYPGEGMLLALDADVMVAKVHDAAKKEPETVVIGDTDLVPSEALWKHFSAQQPREVYSADTRNAISAMGLTEKDCPSCGIAYYRDGLVQVMLGRGLRSQDVAWAGNPDEPKLRIGGILCPRNSFEMFMEKARKESRSWSTSDIHVFIAFMVRVCEHSHNRMMGTLKVGIEDANMKYFNAISRAKENCEFFVSLTATVVCLRVVILVAHVFFLLLRR